MISPRTIDPRPIEVKDEIGYISLTLGKVALIDAADIYIVSQFNWSTRKHGRTFYAVTNAIKDGKKITLSLHRLLCKEKEVDHEDGDGLNNRRYNLRISTHAQNSKNRRLQTNNTSGFKGVTYKDKKSRPWRARIMVDGRAVALGYFAFIEDAARAYDEAARKHFGKFACLNFPQTGERGAR